jgi:hypothetical protein
VKYQARDNLTKARITIHSASSRLDQDIRAGFKMTAKTYREGKRALELERSVTPFAVGLGVSMLTIGIVLI